MNFILNSKLEQDSFFIRSLSLCELRLINHKDFPWVILIPRRENLIELTDLNDKDYYQLNLEIRQISKLMQAQFKPDKLNIATIGNVVSQLHIHIIARYKSDKLFPKPIWGDILVPYDEKTKVNLLSSLNSQLPS